MLFRSCVELDYKWGVIDKSGKEVIPCKYDFIYDFCEGLAKVRLDGKYGYIDKSGKEVIPCKYDGAKFVSDGLIGVKRGKKWGVY